MKTINSLFDYIIQQLELFTVCAQSQPGFIQQVLGEKMALTDLTKEIMFFFKVNGSITSHFGDKSKPLAKTCAQKIIGLLAELS